MDAKRRTVNKAKNKHLSQEQLLEAIRKKKECNARAQAIVESFLERHVDENDFLAKLKDINRNHYDDIVEERHILCYCSYPLCDVILQNVPTKQYQISTLNNKIYDITDRKKFCSAQCFKASEYIKSQLLTSPLWLRHQESLPQFKSLKVKDDPPILEFQSIKI